MNCPDITYRNFDAMDEISEWAVANASHLANLDRLAREAKSAAVRQAARVAGDRSAGGLDSVAVA